MIHPTQAAKILIAAYSETNHSNIHARLGRSEYSYYFVLKAFVPVLEEVGELVVVTDLGEQLDALKRRANEERRPLVLLFFAPPHRMSKIEGVRTIPVVAWEFDRIPDETWDDNPYNDWRVMLGECGAAITHSAYAQAAIRRAMGESYNVVSIPAPVWDRFARLSAPQPGAAPVKRDLEFKGALLDSRDVLPAYTPQVAREIPMRAKYIRRQLKRGRQKVRLLNALRSWVRLAPLPVPQHRLHLQGTVYASILNPRDYRKNWLDMASAFICAFQDREDATLLFKFSETDSDESFALLTHLLRRHQPLKCRVIAFNGYLDDANFARFLSSIDYVVNASTGEGQCLPLMELMSMGKPAIAPLNTSMHDYVTPANAFIVDSDLEPAIWPQDPRTLVRARQYRISWRSLHDAFQESKRVIDDDPKLYAEKSRQAQQVLQAHCSYACTVGKLREFFSSLDLTV